MESMAAVTATVDIHVLMNLTRVLNELIEIIESGKIGAIAKVPQIGSRQFRSNFWKIVDRDLNKVFIQNCQSVGLPIQQGQFSYS